VSITIVSPVFLGFTARLGRRKVVGFIGFLLGARLF
jgi:hypothetical protein